jgi:hypothetical protein
LAERRAVDFDFALFNDQMYILPFAKEPRRGFSRVLYRTTVPTTAKLYQPADSSAVRRQDIIRMHSRARGGFGDLLLYAFQLMTRIRVHQSRIDPDSC